MSKLDIFNSWFSRVWVGGELGTIAEYFTEDSSASGVMRGLDMRPEDFAELIPALMRMIDAPQMEVLRHIETEAWLWVLVRLRATSARTGAAVEFTAQISMRFEGERIAEAYNHVDLLGFLEQLGALPEETLALCLSGERLE